jgi:hypothetical protein
VAHDKRKGSDTERPELSRHFILAWTAHRGLKGVELAKRVAAHAKRPFGNWTLSRIEAQETPHQQWQLDSIAAVLGCSQADLLSGPPAAKSHDKAPEMEYFQATIETVLEIMAELLEKPLTRNVAAQLAEAIGKEALQARQIGLEFLDEPARKRIENAIYRALLRAPLAP